MLPAVVIKISADGAPVAYSPITRMGNISAKHTRSASCVLFILVHPKNVIVVAA
jgi:hypothetical protein